MNWILRASFAKSLSFVPFHKKILSARYIFRKNNAPDFIVRRGIDAALKYLDALSGLKQGEHLVNSCLSYLGNSLH